MKKVVIVGAGPAGLTAAYTLAGNAEILLIDKGKRVEERKCPRNGKCAECGLCDKMSGVGGVGCFSDGKFVFEKIFGQRQVGINFSGIVPENQREEVEKNYIIQARKIYDEFSGKSVELPSDKKIAEARKIARTARSNGMDYIFAMQDHVGTSNLPDLIKGIEDSLEKRGVKIKTKVELKGFNREKHSAVFSDGSEEIYDYLLLGLGREGAIFTEEQIIKNNIPHIYRPIDKGFRVEAPSEILEELVDVARDVKLTYVRSNGDVIRTFCVCPNGIVMREKHKRGEFNLVNGHSDPANPTPNTNFALLMHMPLKYKDKTMTYAKQLAELMVTWSDKTIGVQRLEDFIRNSKTKPEKLAEQFLKPTLVDCEPGDLGGAIPVRYANGLLEGLRKLNDSGLMRGIYDKDTLLYWPEIKFNGMLIQDPSVYLIGDGGGMSRGIVGAMASGIYTAEGILNQIGKN